MASRPTIKDVERDVRAILARMGNLPPAHQPELKLDSACGEPCLTLDGYVYVTEIETERDTIGGKVPAVDFEVGVIVHNPGVHYYPDGSGEPPSDDPEPVGEPVQRACDAAKQAICLWFESQVESALESLADDDMARVEAEEESLAQMDTDPRLHPTTGEEG